MFSRFFIDRPIFASVISLMITLAGAVCFLKLPVAQFPDIVPPVVTVTATYTGADVETLVESVAIPIEQQVNGVDNMIYMSSTCSSNGSYTLTVTFEVGTDPDIATVLTQNRVALAEPSLPQEVTRLGVSVTKRSTNLLGIFCLVEKERFDDAGKKLPPRRTDLYLANFDSIFVKDELARVHGVGQATIMDAKDYSMRIWLDPNVLAERNISVQEVQSIIKEQNVQVATGRMGSPPVPEGQVLDLTINTKGRLATAEEFENLVVRSDKDGRTLLLKDIGRVELGGYINDQTSTLDGRPASTLGIYQSPGANAIEVMENVWKKIEELKPVLDNSGLEIVCAYDSTLFVTESIGEVEETLFLAVLIVIGVVFIFLQDWRAAVIPTLVIPVSLVGCFFFMAIFNFSLNTLTMFGLVLVIGIVVDDAIVVVENTQRILNLHPEMSPNEAAKQSMSEVSGPIMATTCVLCAVFVPTTFISGMVGQIYTQFALTIATSVVLSALCALTISPALCAIFLRPKKEARFFFFRWFNKGFDGFASGYYGILGAVIKHPVLLLFAWFGLLAALYWGMKAMPSGFLPNEDQGVVFVDIRLPDGAALERTEKVRQTVEQIVAGIEGQENSLWLSGYSMLSSTTSTNQMMGVIRLKEWAERPPELSAFNIQRVVMQKIRNAIPDSQVVAFLPPPIMGVGTSGGIEAQLLDTRGLGNRSMYEQVQTLSDKSLQSGIYTSIYSPFRPTVPKLYLDIDREKAKKMQLDLNEVFASVQTYFGSCFVNDFNNFQRVFHVMVQADGKDRNSIEQILSLPLLNSEGVKLTLRSIATVRQTVGPDSLTRFNLSASSQITGSLGPGLATGDGIKELREIEKSFPAGYKIAWSGMTYQETSVGTTIAAVFVLAMLFGFLALAAQYESWSAPIIIMMAVPLGVSGALLAVALRGLDVNIYTQIGLILMVGLSAKNAILITEVARDHRLKDGMEILESATSAGRQRLRPIMMTSFAFILGVVPLAIASGAGANSRRAIGTAVCGGMLEETMVGIVVTPVLFVLLTVVSEWMMKKFRKALS